MFYSSVKFAQNTPVKFERVCAGVAIFETGLISGTYHINQKDEVAVIVEGKYNLGVFARTDEALKEIKNLHDKLCHSELLSGLNYQEYKERLASEIKVAASLI